MEHISIELFTKSLTKDFCINIIYLWLEKVDQDWALDRVNNYISYILRKRKVFKSSQFLNNQIWCNFHSPLSETKRYVSGGYYLNNYHKICYFQNCFSQNIRHELILWINNYVNYHPCKNCNVDLNKNVKISPTDSFLNTRHLHRQVDLKKHYPGMTIK